jgi:hypothetical protein
VPLNVITLAHKEADNINQMIALTEQNLWLADCKKAKLVTDRKKDKQK